MFAELVEVELVDVKLMDMVGIYVDKRQGRFWNAFYFVQLFGSSEST